jgi:hypothetical protein
MYARHTDWQYSPDIPILGPILWVLTWPLSMVPRSWTEFPGDPPRMLIGNVPAYAHLDITPPGTWALVWPPYITFQTKSRWHLGLGVRWDYNDHQYHFPRITFKRLG